MMHNDPQTTDLLQLLLAEQRELTAVEMFAQRHEQATEPLHQSFYQDLIPLTQPASGEQYAFVVDMDACSGCKACVAACHQLNGLEETEDWREVGTLPLAGGGDYSVTTACHHCVDPGCMRGCPVGAYEKDGLTGIVRHLDDQCIGCKYCTMTCPYDVPTYSSRLGIVRKCDMCHQRLAKGEAPACVQSCPNQAISIQLVSQDAIRKADHRPEATMVPGAPASNLTTPTSTYVGREATLLPQTPLTVGESHWPLATLLALTGGSIGLQGVVVVSGVPVTSLLAVVVTLLMLVGLGIGVLHLGRPLLAFRSVLGLRTSWLSREFVVFGAYAGMLSIQLLLTVTARESLPAGKLGWLAAVAGAAGLGCSVMIYAVTGRDDWSRAWTTLRFFGPALVLGLGFAAAAGVATDQASIALPAAVGALLLIAMDVVRLSRFSLNTPSRRRNALLHGSLLHSRWAAVVTMRMAASLCFAFGVTSAAAAAWGCVVLLSGEVLDRMLFFMASSPDRMPGARS